MEKQEIISFIETQIADGKISREDLLNINADKHETSKNLINIFYVIGAIIAIIGITILTVQNWSDIGFFGRIFITLGISLIAYIFGYLLKDKEKSTLSQIMFSMSAVLAPVGSGVLLYEADIETTPIVITSISLLWTLVYGLALWATRKNILILITTFFASVAVYAFASDIFSISYSAPTFFKWLTIFMGISYLLIAYSLSGIGDEEKKSVKSILYGLGTIGVLASGMSLGGVFDLIMIAVIFGSFYASVYLKSRVMLILSAIFLVAHIMQITSEYFAESMNWALALIFAGFMIIGIGYATFYLNKKYISSSL